MVRYHSLPNRREASAIVAKVPIGDVAQRTLHSDIFRPQCYSEKALSIDASLATRLAACSFPGKTLHIVDPSADDGVILGLRIGRQEYEWSAEMPTPMLYTTTSDLYERWERTLLGYLKAEMGLLLLHPHSLLHQTAHSKCLRKPFLQGISIISRNFY